MGQATTAVKSIWIIEQTNTRVTENLDSPDWKDYFRQRTH